MLGQIQVRKDSELDKISSQLILGKLISAGKQFSGQTMLLIHQAAIDYMLARVIRQLPRT